MKQLKLFCKKYMWKRKLNFNTKTDSQRTIITLHKTPLFNGEIYIQIDGVEMGSPLGTLLANTFMISLEEKVLPKVSN